MLSGGVKGDRGEQGVYWPDHTKLLFLGEMVMNTRRTWGLASLMRKVACSH